MSSESKVLRKIRSIKKNRSVQKIQNFEVTAVTTRVHVLPPYPSHHRNKWLVAHARARTRIRIRASPPPCLLYVMLLKPKVNCSAHIHIRKTYNIRAADVFAAAVYIYIVSPILVDSPCNIDIHGRQCTTLVISAPAKCK